MSKMHDAGRFFHSTEESTMWMVETRMYATCRQGKSRRGMRFALDGLPFHIE